MHVEGHAVETISEPHSEVPILTKISDFKVVYLHHHAINKYKIL